MQRRAEWVQVAVPGAQLAVFGTGAQAKRAALHLPHGQVLPRGGGDVDVDGAVSPTVAAEATKSARGCASTNRSALSMYICRRCSVVSSSSREDPCATPSNRSTRPSKPNLSWNDTAAAPPPGSQYGSCNASSPSPPPSGTTTTPAHPSTATTTDPRNRPSRDRTLRRRADHPGRPLTRVRRVSRGYRQPPRRRGLIVTGPALGNVARNACSTACAC